MNCLCCSKPFTDKATPDEIATGWHKRCVKKFFGTNILPEIDLNSDVIEQLAIESTNKGLTVTGVQKKLSLHLTESKNEKPRLTLINYPTGYILKPQTEEYQCLPESEFLVMRLAEMSGIKVVPYALIKVDNQYAYITKRVDRVDNDKLGMEDFCQLDGRMAVDKYKGSYERCGKVIAKYSNTKKLDSIDLFVRIVFCFVVGNSDMHLKNFSLIETSANSKQFVLSNAYDLLPVNVVNPADTEETALTLNGKKRNIRRKDFITLAESMDIDVSVAERLIDSILMKADMYIKECMHSYMTNDLKENMIELIQKRATQISKQ